MGTYDELANKAEDYLGNRYINVKTMCKVYGITVEKYRRRLRSGWTVEEALTGIKKGMSITDCEGTVIEDLDVFCKENKVNKSQLIKCVEKGMTIGEAIEKKINAPVVDHLGNVYATKKEMCAKYNVNPSTLERRLDRGMPLEEALMKEVKHITYEAVDHLGNTYSSEKEMCDAYGLSHDSFKYRIKKGWTLEKALTCKNPNAVKDHKGNYFDSFKDMCRCYGINYNTLKKRVNSGWTLEEALMPEHVKKPPMRKHIVKKEME